MQTIGDKQTVLFAQPYDISAEGFYFASTEQYATKAANNRNSLGLPVEEYEIQFIDGDMLDAELFQALSINQANFGAFIDACNYWNTDQKRKIIIAVGQCGHSFDLKTGDPDAFDIELYEMDRMSDLARHFVDEEIFGKLPEWVKWHLDYESIGRDLANDYAETMVAGIRLIYRCG